jgi:hypothetical protein
MFSSRWGYGGLSVVNLYPFRSPSPAECRRWATWWNREDWYARDALQQNEQVVARTAKSADLVVAAWGAGTWDDAWVEHVVDEVTCGVEPWPHLQCLGVTENGSPKHPLARGSHWVPNDQQPVLWRSAV